MNTYKINMQEFLVLTVRIDKLKKQLKECRTRWKDMRDEIVLDGIHDTNNNKQSIEISNLIPGCCSELNDKTLITRKRKRRTSALTKKKMIELYATTMCDIYNDRDHLPLTDRIDIANNHVENMFNKCENNISPTYVIDFNVCDKKK